MQSRVNRQGTIGTCGCGRSPTGNCIGWHGLTEDDYLIKKNEWQLQEYKKQVQDMWNNSCTNNRKQDD